MSERPLVPDRIQADLDGMITTAQADIDALTSDIAGLSARLEEARHTLQRLEHTRQTLEEIAARHATAPAEPLPAGYTEILAILTRSEHGIRPKEVCRALGMPEEHKTIEGIRAKLKRLVGRELAQELQPGLFSANRPNT